VRKAHTPTQFAAAVRRATELLRAGEVVALPTETVYGLAANAWDAMAVRRLFEVKGRPARNPIIVHVASRAMARQCVARWPALAEKLARAFWPGPLTLVLPRARAIPGIVTAGGPTVGVRWPSHPLIQAVIRACGFPLAAPSANLSQGVSPTTAAHVQAHLGDRIPLIIDGGAAPVGIESTVLDLCASPPRVLRPGMIHAEALLAVTGRLAAGAHAGQAGLRSPGLLRKHYAPRARLIALAWADDQDLARQLRARRGSGTARTPLKRCLVIAHTRIPSAGGFHRVSVLPHDPAAFARAIYAELHAADAAGIKLILVEALPPTVEWQAIADRLSRAAAR
jgi:L-threonylcarbamoyladenylate synthase